MPSVGLQRLHQHRHERAAARLVKGPCPPMGSTQNLSGSSVGGSWTCPVKPLDRRGLARMEARDEDSSPIDVLPAEDRRIGGNDRSWCRARAVHRATTSCGHTVKSVAYCTSMDPEHSRSSLAVLQRPAGGLQPRIRHQLASKGSVLGSFSCRGFDMVAPLRLIDGVNKARPNDRDLGRATAFAARLRKRGARSETAS